MPKTNQKKYGKVTIEKHSLWVGRLRVEEIEVQKINNRYKKNCNHCDKKPEGVARLKVSLTESTPNWRYKGWTEYFVLCQEHMIPFLLRVQEVCDSHFEGRQRFSKDERKLLKQLTDCMHVIQETIASYETQLSQLCLINRTLKSYKQQQELDKAMALNSKQFKMLDLS